MDGKQALVGAGGAALVLGEWWFGPDRKTLTDGTMGAGSPADAHKVLKKIGIEAGFVLGAVLVAGVSDAGANAMLALLAVLTILWFINRKPTAATGTPGAGITQKAS